MKKILLLAVALAGLAGSFFWLRPADQATSPAAVPAPKPLIIFELAVSGGKLVRGEPVLKVTQGDTVVLRVTADRDDELHLHGYDLSLALKAGVAGILSFRAERSGRFDYELHHAHAEVGTLEVSPR